MSDFIVECSVDCDGGVITCWSCGGEGAQHDCGEDACCCAEPELDDLVVCDQCKGAGGWECPVCRGGILS